MFMQSPHTLSLLARRIEETQSTLDYHVCEVERLGKLLAELRADFNETTNFNAPIESLPNEVLAMVFQAGCILPCRKVHRLNKRPEPPFELLVSLISRRWRNVAISTPKLWTKICVLSQKPLDLVVAYLTRSGILPLDIQAVLRFNRSSSFSVNSFLEVFMPQIGRWRSMCIRSNRSGHYHYLRPIFRHIRPATAPLLESLQIIVGDHDNDELEGDTDHNDTDSDDSDEIGDEGEEEEEEDEEEEDEYSDIDDEDSESSDWGVEQDGDVGDILTGSTPALRLFRLMGIGLHLCVPPGSTLTTLHIHGVRPLSFSTTCSKFRDILDNLSALTHLFVHGWVIREQDVPIRASILPILSSLHLSSSGGYDSQVALLAIISAPMLECLTLKRVWMGNFSMSLFQRPEWTAASPRYPRLRFLSLTPNSTLVPQENLNDFHRIFSTVTEFEVLNIGIPHCFQYFNSEELNANSMVSTSERWWPSLQTLTLTSLCDYDVGPLHKFLSDRIAQGYPVRKLRFETITVTHRDLFGDICGRMGVVLEKVDIRNEVDHWCKGWYCDGD
jgi:hypothetical protein